MNDQTNTYNWFNGCYIPARLVSGLFYRPTSSLLFVVDHDTVTSNEDAIYPGSDMSHFDTFHFRTGSFSFVHGGGEWHAFASANSDVYVRFGTYTEPSQVENFSNRKHWTSGFEWRYSYFDLSFSQDKAPDFSNLAIGLGIAL